MGLSDFLTVPFLISLGITFILVGILGMFLSQRIMDQNHKISSMMGLVSSVVDELNFVRTNLQVMAVQPPLDKQAGAGLGAGLVSGSGPVDNEEQSLISVSDEEEDSDEEDSDDEEENEIIEHEDLTDEPTIKVIDMGETMNLNYLQEEEVEVEEEEEEEESEEDDDLEELEELEEQNEEQEEEKKVVAKPDIKKMNLQALREFAISRGIMGDISKIKKAELVKMIEDQM